MSIEIEMLRKISYFSMLSTGELAQVAAVTVGSTREVVGRALKELETAGSIEMRHGQAVVLNRERLRIIAL